MPCGQCASAESVCVYSESKRDRVQKVQNELELVKQKADHYEGILREISHEVELPVAKKIGRALVRLKLLCTPCLC